MRSAWCCSRFNLEVTLAELAACRQAVHDGRIWELAERRSHAHPALREAFLWLTTSPLGERRRFQQLSTC